MVSHVTTHSIHININTAEAEHNITQHSLAFVTSLLIVSYLPLLIVVEKSGAGFRTTSNNVPFPMFQCSNTHKYTHVHATSSFQVYALLVSQMSLYVRIPQVAFLIG